MTSLFSPVDLAHGPSLAHRLTLAPLTTMQSEPKGAVSDHDIAWYKSVVNGGYSLYTTGAAYIRPEGKSYPGQLGAHSDDLLPGLAQLASLPADETPNLLQLHHGGIKFLHESNGEPVAPMDMPNGARGLSTAEVEELRDDFVAAALRAESAGFTGVDIHAGEGWLLSQFFSPLYNRRTDRYGGDFAGRSRLLFEILSGIREASRQDFQVGLRLTVEKHGQIFRELVSLAEEVMASDLIDYLVIAPWNIDEFGRAPGVRSQNVMQIFADLSRGKTLLGGSGKIMGAERAQRALTHYNLDFLQLGSAAIVDPAFPKLAQADSTHLAPSLPVSAQYLHNEVGLSSEFIGFLMRNEGFVKQ